MQVLHAAGLLFSFAVDEAHCVTSWGAQQAALQRICMQRLCAADWCSGAPVSGMARGFGAFLMSNVNMPLAGHDFRPAYLHLAKLRATYPGVPFVALVSCTTGQACSPRTTSAVIKKMTSLCCLWPYYSYDMILQDHHCMQTATATPEVRSAIVEQLALQSPAILAASFNRPNIRCRTSLAPSLSVMTWQLLC